MRPTQHPVVLPRIFLSGIPDLGAENLRLVILHQPGTVGRNPLATSTGPFYEQLVQLSVAEEHGVNFQLPVAVSGRLELVGRCALPVVELTNQIDPTGVRSPLPNHPRAVRALVQSVVEMVVDTGGKSFDSSSSHLLRRVNNPLVPRLDRRLEWLKVRVCVIYPEFLIHGLTRFATIKILIILNISKGSRVRIPDFRTRTSKFQEPRGRKWHIRPRGTFEAP